MKTRFGMAALPVVLVTLGWAGVGQAAQRPVQRSAQRQMIPANTVVRVRLDDKLSSKTDRRGDRFSATVDRDDRSGFPDGTRFEGTITEAQRSTRDQPGVLDMEVRTAILPNGSRVPVYGHLASLDDKDVRRLSDGRMEARSRKGKKFDAKWVGYGAAGGAVLSTVLGGGVLKGALLGALGGAAYSYVKGGKGGKHGEFSDVELDRGKEFGIRLDNRVAFNDLGRR
jgi:hypothetical protein